MEELIGGSDGVVEENTANLTSDLQMKSKIFSQLFLSSFFSSEVFCLLD